MKNEQDYEANQAPQESEVAEAYHSKAETSDEAMYQSPADVEPPTSSLTAERSSSVESEAPNEDRPVTGASNPPVQQKRKTIKRMTLIAASLSVMVLTAVVSAVVLFVDQSVVNESAQEAQGNAVSLQGAAITDVEGTVEYNTGGGWNEIKDWTEIEQTNQIRTLADSRAVITLDDGSAIRLDSNTSVTLARLGNDEVIINNESGQVYTRVSPSDSRVFLVMVGEDEYRALGTAYKTVNDPDEKGVEVYQSKVQTQDAEQQPREVVEGQAFYTKHSEASKVGKPSSIDLDKLKDDDFMRWNHKKDLAEKEYADKLGVLVDIDKPRKQEQEPQPQPQPAPQLASGISVSGVKTDDGIKVSWSVRGVDTSNGFKVVYSNSDAAPTYGKHSAQYVGAGTYSTTIKIYDGKAWYVRVCAYRGEAGCVNYSNAIKVTAPAKEVSKEKVTRGVISASLSGSKLSWTYTGKAPYGYKVTWSESLNPTYPENNSIYINGTSLDLSKKLGSKQGKYNVRVCAYTAGTESAKCVDYSANTSY